MLIPPRRILLSGGGIRAVAHLGALQFLESKGLLKAVKEIVGVMYMNDGDFVESCSALVEHRDGRWEIIYWLEVIGEKNKIV